MWKCSLCNAEPSDDCKSLKKHITECHTDPTGNFLCGGTSRLCSMNRFGKYLAFYAHLNQVHRSGPFTCNICDLSFDSLYNLCRHRKGSHGNALLKCLLCGIEYRGRKFSEHANKCHKNEAGFYVCNRKGTCFRKFKSSCRLRKHMNRLRKSLSLKNQNSSDLKPCSLCGIKYKNRKFQDHADEYHKTKAGFYECGRKHTSCYTRFKKIRNFRRHLSRRLRRAVANPVLCENHPTSTVPNRQKLNRRSIFQCHYCEISFDNETLILAHLKNEHHNESNEVDLSKLKIEIPVRQKNLICSICGNININTRSLKRHIMSVHDLNPIIVLNLRIKQEMAEDIDSDGSIEL